MMVKCLLGYSGGAEDNIWFLFVCVQEGDTIFYWNPIRAHHSDTSLRTDKFTKTIIYIQISAVHTVQYTSLPILKNSAKMNDDDRSVV